MTTTPENANELRTVVREKYGAIAEGRAVRRKPVGSHVFRV